MATVVYTELEIHDAKLYAPGGMVNRWSWEIAEKLEYHAREYAPPRRSRSLHGHIGKGALAASISGGVWQVDPHTLSITLSVGTDHAVYVLGGTAAQGTRFIYSAAGWRNKAMVDRWARRRAYRRQMWVARDDLPRGLFMRVPPGPGGTTTRHLRVKGQRSNPFMSDAYYTTRLKHRSLPAMPGMAKAFSSGYFGYND